jgi:hypothetical protein
MGRHSAVPANRHRFAGGLLLGSMASGALAIGDVSSAATAAAAPGSTGSHGPNVTSPFASSTRNVAVSINGVLVRQVGTATASSTLGSIAKARGDGATATANGTGDVVRAVGAFTIANADGNFDRVIARGPNTAAETEGSFDLAKSSGNNSIARSEGTANRAVVRGTNSVAQAGGTPTDTGNRAVNIGNGTALGDSYTVATGNFNVARNFGDNNFVAAQGLLSSAFNIVGNGNTVFAYGVLNNATNIFGSNNTVEAFNLPLNLPLDLPSSLAGIDPADIGGNVAFNAFGNGNTAIAGLGPFAIAGLIGQTDQTVTQETTGIHIDL